LLKGNDTGRAFIRGHHLHPRLIVGGDKPKLDTNAYMSQSSSPVLQHYCGYDLFLEHLVGVLVWTTLGRSKNVQVGLVAIVVTKVPVALERF
jgi:hypothetical protein